MDINTEKFIEIVKQDCKDNDITLTLCPDAFVTTDIGCECNGYFDESSRELAVATGKPLEKWLRTLVHEYGHMNQWKEQTDIWLDAADPCDAEELVELWYAHEIEFTEEKKKFWIAKGRNVELDCEKRTVELIKKFNLPLDTEQYIKQANAYIYFWTFTGLSRSWYKIGREPYNIPEIVETMPNHFDNDYEVLSVKQIELFMRCCS